MTTIKIQSMVEDHDKYLEVRPYLEGGTNVVVHDRTNGRAQGITVPTAELLDALGAVDKATFDDVVRTHVEARVQTAAEARGQYWIAAHDHQRVLGEYRARREAAEAKLAKVQAVADEFYKVRGDWETKSGRAALKAKLLAALADPEPFVLPTEVPARIEASDQNGPHHLALWTDGENLLWHSSVDGDDYSPEQVMEHFTDHEILEPEL